MAAFSHFRIAPARRGTFLLFFHVRTEGYVQPSGKSLPQTAAVAVFDDVYRIRTQIQYQSGLPQYLCRCRPALRHGNRVIFRITALGGAFRGDDHPLYGRYFR